MIEPDVEEPETPEATEETPEETPEAALPTSAVAMDDAQLQCLIEALLFASDRPLTLARLRQLTRVSDTARLEQALGAIAELFAERGLVLQQVSGGYQFRTHSRFSAWVQQLIEGRPVRLTRAQLETLAIIAYRQPITRPEIDEIRGVDSSATLKLLLERSLVRVLGKREEVGRPMLYGTTKDFLDFFSLSDLRELPTLREYSELTAESRQVMSHRLGIEPDDVPGPLPEDTISDGGLPEETIAEAVPEETVPDEAMPEEAMADEAMPEEAMAEEAMPEDAVPEDAAPDSGPAPEPEPEHEPEPSE